MINDDIITCPCCHKAFNSEDCESDKYWKEDKKGVSHHLVEYKCPHCDTWISEDELS